MNPVNITEFEAIARAKMPQMSFDYYASGANDEITLRENDAAFDRIRLRYRVLRGVANRSTATTLLGHPLKLPVIVAPSAYLILAHPYGEVATVRAAGTACTLLILCTLSSRAVVVVTDAATGAGW